MTSPNRKRRIEREKALRASRFNFWRDGLGRVGMRRLWKERTELRANIKTSAFTVGLFARLQPWLFACAVVWGIASSPSWSVHKIIQNFTGQNSVVWDKNAWRDTLDGMRPILAVAPTAAISLDSVVASRMAPHIVGVHATNTTAGTGTLATCTFQWTASGDPITGTMTYYDP